MSKKNGSQGSSETPLMKQYYGVKAKYPGALVLFRVGDFYETFGDDAIITSKVLGIVLTKRANGAASHIELAGFPHHSLDSYLPKLVRAGYKVAICDQLEDPKLTKTIVKRGVTELVSPGVSYNDKILEHNANNYLASVYFNAQEIGMSFLDISTGEFFVASGNQEYAEKLLQGLRPSEVICSRDQKKQLNSVFGENIYINTLDEWVYQMDYARDKLVHHFQTLSLKGFGIEDDVSCIISAGAIIQYLHDNQHHTISHINQIQKLQESEFVWLDRFTIRNLEILNTPHENGTSLLQILDRTSTPMGGRLLRRWLVFPLKDLQAIHQRHAVIEEFLKNADVSSSFAQLLKQCGDPERLASKLAIRRINPRELYQLYKTSSQFKPLIHLLQNSTETFRQEINPLHHCDELTQLLFNWLSDDPPIQVSRGQVIKNGADPQLDEYRELILNGKDHLVQMQQREAAATGIPSLKISYNHVFGYYIEVTHVHRDKVPTEWIRKQTLTNAERYITPELKEYEDKILGAEDKMIRLEEELYIKLIDQCISFVQPLLENARIIARLDVLHAFSETARTYNYCKPVMNDGFSIDLRGCRHPVIERLLPSGNAYIDNDIYLDAESHQVIVLTGPNMSGKSALLRQTGLTVLMAQMGCYVPCRSASIGWFDRIYTRVGASDNLSGGESTFMVEMLETAGILNNLSSRSLVLLDEIGRGTSTYDGVSLAWSIAEYLNQHPGKPRTFFATHYHELNELESKYPGICNMQISIKEHGNQIIFLRKLIPGGSEHSFGIHVARMAGLPKKVVERSEQILMELESGRTQLKATSVPNAMQLSLFSLDDPLLTRINEELEKIEINTLTPVEALLKLQYLKKIIGNHK